MADTLNYVSDEEIIVSEGNALESCPYGTHPAVCVDIVSLGLVEREFEGEKTKQPKVVVVWQVLPEDGMGGVFTRRDGSRFTAEREFTASLHPKSRLRPFLEQWRGRDFLPEELQGFNLAKLKYANCLLTVEHKANRDNTDFYANVIAAEPFKDAQGKVVTEPGKLLKPENYSRRDYSKKSKPSQPQVVNGADQSSNPDWVPF